MKNNVLVITYWSFDDALIQAYTLPYVKLIKRHLPAGSTVTMVTLEKQVPNQVRIRSALKGLGIDWIFARYQPFGFRAFIMWAALMVRLTYIILIRRIDVIHCWATPPGAIGYVLSVLTGRRLIIDSYEPHAESMVENGTWKQNSLAFRILFFLERKQSQRAEVLIAAATGMDKYAENKYGSIEANLYVKPACVDLELFSLKKVKNEKLLDELNLSDKIVCVYAGKFGGIYFGDEIFSFWKVAIDFWGDTFRVVLLSSHTQVEIDLYCKRAGIDPSIIHRVFVPHAEVPDYMGLGDFAINPVKPVPSKRYCTPIKTGEYWALGLPVVIPANISDDSDIIRENDIGAVMLEITPKAFGTAIEKIDELLKRPKDRTQSKVRNIAVRYREFSIADSIYRIVYGSGGKNLT